MQKLMNDAVPHPQKQTFIPARLGFLILLHKDMPAAIELLLQIYRPYFWYVIHVDKRSSDALKELQLALGEVFSYAKNIYVLPPEHSFATSWGSYEIVRAELEGFEKLLQIGNWDFIINLSGADLPLRDVDDLAAALASHRGLNFLPFVRWRNNDIVSDENSLNTAVFHSCDSYVYNVTATSRIPNPKEIKIYNSPQWGAFSRDFVAYLVNETARTNGINRFQFYLQTFIVPDETYVPTILMNSKFRNTFRPAFIHMTKQFSSVDLNNLCRHSSEADFCGQGPSVFSIDDIHDLWSASHRSFFARKFPTHFPEEIRSIARNLATEGYYDFIHHNLPKEILKVLAENAIPILFQQEKSLKGHRLVFESLLHLRVFPSLIPHDHCCQSSLILQVGKISDHRFWMDFSFLDTEDAEVKKARIELRPTINGRVCYADGNLKMIFLTPWRLKMPETIKDKAKLISVALDQTLPFPYGPAFVTDIIVLLVISRKTEEIANCIDDDLSGVPFFFSVIADDILSSNIIVQLISPDDEIRCIHNETVTGNTVGDKINQSASLIYPFLISCGIMEPGPWKIHLWQDDVIKPRIYKVPFYLLDYSNSKTLSNQLDDVVHLWEITGTFLLSHHDEKIRIPPEKNYYDQKKIWLNGKSYELKILDHKIKQASKAPLILQHEDKMVLFRREDLYFRYWFVCYGGIIACLLFPFMAYWWIFGGINWKTYMISCFLCLITGTVLQIIILLNFC